MKINKSYKNPKDYAWRLCSQYNRMKDADENGIVTCCSCNRKGHWRTFDAGHYEAKGTSSGLALEFYDRNIHAQCPQCNRFGGNTKYHKQNVGAKYSQFMLEKYGKEIFEELEKVKRKMTYDINYIDLINEYKEKIKKYDSN